MIMPDKTQNTPRERPPGYQTCSLPRDTVANESEPPCYHNGAEFMRDADLPLPPPEMGYLSSSSGNAPSDDAERAHIFCEVPLYLPTKPSGVVYSSAQVHDLHPVWSRDFQGDLKAISRGRWKGSTRDRSGDCLVSTNYPVYFSVEDSPFATKNSRTIYFEIKLLGLRAEPGAGATDSSGFSIGFIAQPYPYWRSPGWEREGIGVFSDDGCRFVNDSWGGKKFTEAFGIGETVGLGITFRLPLSLPTTLENRNNKCEADIFFTRAGDIIGAWDLHEEVDEDSGSLEGLEGDFDLYGAIGLFGGVDFEVCFDRVGWLWQPP
ncbi:hypothetical protein BDV25DRAFT_164820 [Aspergillus avenaceus]|uniref:SPRY domain-containing protein n=1 Tax=Aspergillus avenaceus TaxID=36643 RepID=A0A5N6TG80_ASPAV|nr:hypothetical protein BDV25DRAFT_164820 [Aspergillus avenaceus]